MRVTDKMVSNRFLTNLYKSTSNTDRYGQQLSANTKILKMSDDPINSLKAIQAGKDISAKTQYATNVADAQSTLTEVETCLDHMDEMYQRLTTLTTAASTGLYGSNERAAVVAELNEMKTELVSTGNSTYNGKYLFGGYNTASAPFEIQGDGSVLYNGVNLVANGADVAGVSNQELKYEISEGTTLNVSYNGAQLMGTGENNLVNVLDNFINTLEDPNSTTSDIAAFQDKFSAGLDKVLNMVTEVGAKQSRLELVANRYEDEQLNLKDVLSDAEDIDQAQVITDYKQASAIYELTLQVGARIIQPSLLDFLK